MNPTTLAEEATLGTLLLDPPQVATVQGFLRPADFRDTWHRRIYATMLTRQAAGNPMTPQNIHADLVDAARADDGVRAVRLVSLMEVPPTRPKAARYAALVLEASLRRQVRDLGLLLRAGAVVATADGAGPRAATIGPFAEIGAQLSDARNRWDVARAGTFDTPATPDVTALAAGDAHRLETAMAASRLLEAAPPPLPANVAHAELDVLAAVLARPGDLAGVRGRISGSLFSVEAHLATWAAICDLADLGEPIDAVTVCWQTQREEALRGKGIDAEVVLWLSTHPPAGDATRAARTMAALATRTVADRSAQQLAAAAEHPGINVTDLLDTAARHVAAVQRAITGPTAPRPGSWRRPRHLQLVGPAVGAARSAGRSL